MIIGIGGVSRAGKTTLANQLKSRIKGKTIGILKQDDFVKKAGLPRIKNHVDWEHPDSLDWTLLRSAISSFDKKYDLVIVEGLFAFYDPKINSLYERYAFVYIEETVFKARKKLDLRWGLEPDWFITHIWASFIKFGTLPGHLSPVIMINGANQIPIDHCIQLLNL